jgi:hypothetical protein
MEPHITHSSLRAAAARVLNAQSGEPPGDRVCGITQDSETGAQTERANAVKR